MPSLPPFLLNSTPAVGLSLCIYLCMQTENIRIAYIDEIAPGVSKVSFKLFVPLEQYELGPLKLTGFKVRGVQSVARVL